MSPSVFIFLKLSIKNHFLILAELNSSIFLCFEERLEIFAYPQAVNIFYVFFRGLLTLAFRHSSIIHFDVNFSGHKAGIKAHIYNINI